SSRAVEAQSGKKSVAASESKDNGGKHRDKGSHKVAAFLWLLLHSTSAGSFQHGWFVLWFGIGDGPSPNVGRIIDQHQNARPLDRRQAEKNARIIRLKKIAQQSKKEIPGHELFEEVAFRVWTFPPPPEKHSKCKRKQHFVKLGGMPRYPVPKIHPPRQCRWDSSSMVIEASQKAADAANSNADRKRHRK